MKIFLCFYINSDIHKGDIMPILDILLETLINEVTADEKYEKQYINKLDRALFDKAVELDPTSVGQNKVGKYTDWIIKNKAWEHPALKYMLSRYDKLKSNLDLEFRDINKLDLAKLNNVMDQAYQDGKLISKKEKSQERKEKAADESTIMYDKNGWMIVVPETEFASQYFGAGSDWCTARQEHGRCMFDNYNRRGTLYIVYNKETKEKWQLFVGDDGKEHEYRNSDNNNFNVNEAFPKGVLDFMKENDFPENGAVTDEQISELADEYMYEFSISDNDIRAEVQRSLEQQIRQEVDQMLNWGDDYTAQDALSYVEDNLRRGAYNFNDTMNELQSKLGIDADSDINKKIIAAYAIELGTESLSIDELIEYSNIDTDGVYLGEKPLDDLLDNVSIYTTEQLETLILNWYKHAYKRTDHTVNDIIEIANDYIKNERSKRLGDRDKRDNFENDLDTDFIGKMKAIYSKYSETRDENPQQVAKFESYIHSFLKRLI